MTAAPTQSLVKNQALNHCRMLRFRQGLLATKVKCFSDTLTSSLIKIVRLMLAVTCLWEHQGIERIQSLSVSFSYDDLPSLPQYINLDYIEEAVEWLYHHPKVLPFLLASYRTDLVKAMVAISPWHACSLVKTL